MPSFDGRRTELRVRLRDLSTQLQPIELIRVTSVVEEFSSLRDAALTTVATIVADTGGDELAGDYSNKLSGFRQQINDKIGGMLSGLDAPGPAVVLFRERILVEEAGFWGAPGLTGLAAARDDLLRRGKTMTDMADALDKKWRAFTEEDLRVEQAEEEAARKASAIIQQAIVDQISLVSQAANLAATILSTLGKVDDLVNDWAVKFAIEAGVPEQYARLIPKMSSLAQGAFDQAKDLGISAVELGAILAPILLKDPGFASVEWLKSLMGSDVRSLLTLYSSFKKGLIYALQQPYAEQVTFYRGLLPSQTALVVTFTGTRQDVSKFLEANNTSATREVLDKILGLLDTWASGSLSDGQRADAGLIRATARDALLGRMAGIADGFNRLFSQYDGRFMGALSTNTERQLINTDVWVTTQTGMVQLGLDDRVREWRQTMTDIPARIGESFGRVDHAFDGLPLEIRDRIRVNLDAYLDDTLKGLNSEAQDTQAALDASQLAVNGRKTTTDFDREELRAKLRG